MEVGWRMFVWLVGWLIVSGGGARRAEDAPGALATARAAWAAETIRHFYGPAGKRHGALSGGGTPVDTEKSASDPLSGCDISRAMVEIPCRRSPCRGRESPHTG